MGHRRSDMADCGSILGICIRFTAALAALMTLISASAHVDQLIHAFCKVEPCVGDWLYWNEDSNFWDDKSQTGNTYWNRNGYGAVFTIIPQQFLIIWGPMVLAILAIMEHLAPWRTGVPFKSAAGMCLFHLFLGLFVNFPCAGNWGVMAAMFCFLVSFLAFIAIFVKSARSEPLTYGYLSDCFLYKWMLMCKSEKACKVLGLAMRVSSLVASVLIWLVGLFHVVNQIYAFCDDANPNKELYSCYGPWIFWYDEDFFLETYNGYAGLGKATASVDQITGQTSWKGYGAVFTLDITQLFAIWLPFFLGLLSMAEHIKCISPGYVTRPVSAFWFHFLCMFFICWPCAGNLGIIVGFMLIIPTGIALLMIFVCAGCTDCKTVFGLGPDKVTWVDHSGDSHEYHAVETVEAPRKSKHHKSYQG